MLHILPTSTRCVGASMFILYLLGSDGVQFFLTGTQLKQLSEEYETCWENVNRMANVLKAKESAIPDLYAHYKEVSARFAEADNARKQRHKADELKKELAWAHVASKEEVRGN